MSNWLTALVAIASILFGGGGLAVLVKTVVDAIVGRRQRGAEVADRLSDSTLKWVEQFQEETRAAWQELAHARQEIAGLRLELAECQRGAERLARDLRDIHGAIMSPTATIERLRAMVVGGDHTNGRIS
jgi:chromosome segregation ATPase